MQLHHYTCVAWISFVFSTLVLGQKPTLETVPAAAAVKPELRRTELNLLGATNAQAGESRRNENVQFNLIDNNALKELNVRLGTTATISSEFAAFRNYYGSEFGNSPTSTIHVDRRKSLAGIHGSGFVTHSNSALSARSFFQVGSVKPARENNYGLTGTTALGRFGFLSVDGSQFKIRGNVNGNVLIPKATERTALAADPAARRLIESWLAGYPLVTPNRPDINERALNTNAPQSIDTNAASIRWDANMGARDRLTFRHNWTTQVIDAFQLVAGQNPDTSTRSHNSRLTWERSFNARTVLQTSLGFDRVHSLLVPEPTSPVSRVQIGTTYTSLAPGSNIPIDRVQNRYRESVLLRHSQGGHQFYFGGELSRLQFNGKEASSNRGNYFFRSDFGRDAITNFRLGLASRYSTGIGPLDRGFRRWEQQIFAGDTWRVNNRLTLSYGVRYEPVRGLHEVNGLNEIPFDCDCNNLAPRVGIAFRLPGRAGVLRAAYALDYGELFAATLQQLRWNAPRFLKIEAQAPTNLLNPIEGIALGPNTRTTLFSVPRDLKTPYEHQYNFSWEGELARNWKLQAGYVGSRMSKLLYMWHTNRAAIVPGIALTTETINQRRPDANHFEIRRVSNLGSASFDAGRLTLVVPAWRKMTIDASYWFSKAIDVGGGYTNTAAGDDTRNGISQSERLVQADLKGLSSFDQTHAFLVRWRYELPAIRTSYAVFNGWAKDWSISAVWLAKTGMPFTVLSGSDGPGFGNVDGSNGDRPNLLDASILGRAVSHPDTSLGLLPRNAFAYIHPGEERGNLGLNTFRRGGIANLNASVSRIFKLSSERSFTIRAETINGSNRAQFAEPNADLTSPAFGLITNTLNEGRTFQFTAQFQF